MPVLFTPGGQLDGQGTFVLQPYPYVEWSFPNNATLVAVFRKFEGENATQWTARVQSVNVFQTMGGSA